MISAIVFVFWPDEEDLIEACLSTLAFTDEIIILDGGSTKNTIDKARKFTKRIYKDSSPDFASRHNRGKELAEGDWLLYVDADERISQQLAKEIKEAVKDERYAAYQLRRVNYFLGKEVRYGDRYPDYITRLFRKDNLEEWFGAIHESSKVTGETGRLEGQMYHLTHRNIFTMMEKTVKFSEFEARLRLEAKHPQVIWWRLIRVFMTEFFYRIIKLQGWRQGTEGWIDGIFQAFSLFVVYARLWELQRKPGLPETYREIDRKILAEYK